MSTKDKDKDTVTPKNLRSHSQGHRDSPAAKKSAEKGPDKDKEKVSEKSATKDPKQTSITGYHVEPLDKQSELNILKEIKTFNKK